VSAAAIAVAEGAGGDATLVCGGDLGFARTVERHAGDVSPCGALGRRSGTRGGRGRIGRRVLRSGRRCRPGRQFGFEVRFPGAIAESADKFAADSGNGLQQELGEIAEGDGLLLGDAPLSQEEKYLGEGAVNVGGGGEVGAERFEFRRLERCFLGRLETDVLIFVCGVGIVFCLQGMLGAELGAQVAALAPVGKSELAALVFLGVARLGLVLRRGLRRDPPRRRAVRGVRASLTLDIVGRRKLGFVDAAKLLLWGHVRGEEVTFVGRRDDDPGEIVKYGFEKRRNAGAGEWFLCGRHTKCYR
jgi:hypothetical protein